jgi:hypothetical protein
MVLLQVDVARKYILPLAYGCDWRMGYQCYRQSRDKTTLKCLCLLQIPLACGGPFDSRLRGDTQCLHTA